VPARHRAVSAVVAVLLAVLGAAAPARALDETSLATLLERESKRLGTAAGAHVVDLTDGTVLFSRRADRALIPASNQKLFTTAAALLRFGPAATLQTSVRLAPTATLLDGVVQGDVYLVGGGDPSLNDVALRALARGLAVTHGITAVDGAIVGDETYFDRLRGSFRTSGKPDYDLGGRLGALTWGHGRFDAGGPGHMAAARLQRMLEARGVKVGRRARTGRLATSAAGQDAALATVQSLPMGRLVQITNQPSDNFYAETLVKGLGARFGAGGTTIAGLAVVRDALAPFGIAPTLKDGSGLSRMDRATPRELVTLLAEMREEPFAADWLASLPRPGQPQTTLYNRMRGTTAARRCQAKTGTIRAVSALSGYCTARDGDVIAFSFLENRVCTLCAKRIEDRMVGALTRYDG
jgi:D-alanyl-D-alanine carboxypeptidase/D-alanyl-D-alanine-endopeptidase (penicillin-binding protein 4)